MIIGERLRTLREQQKLSQGDIQKRTGLLRSYISRVENGHTVPSVETLEKMSRALGVPIYQLFYEGENAPVLPKHRQIKASLWGHSGKEARLMAKFHRLLSRTNESNRKLLLHMARKMANHKAV
jgi:transcriptional regulator with XRE-family HTH domain